MKRYCGVMIMVVLILMPVSSFAFPTKKGDKACIDCHKLDKKEAAGIVKKIVPNGTVIDVKASPVKGVWQIEFDAGEGRHGVLGLDFSKKYLIQFASINDVVKQQAAAKQQEPPKKVDVSKIPLDDAIVLGLATATKKVIVFTDPDCPYCRKFHEIMKQVVEKHTDVSFALIMNPLPMHKDSPKKAQTILCTKSSAILDDAFSGKTVPEPAADCTAAAVERSMALAKSLNFNGTPMLVRGDGTVLSGYLPEEKLMEWINKIQ